MKWVLRLCASLSLIAFSPAGADQLPATQESSSSEEKSQEEVIPYDEDRAQRMTVPVTIGDMQYAFVVDTGAERTVISRELADMLSLAAGNNLWLTSIADVRQVETARIPHLDVGRRSFSGIEAPSLSRINVGADGMLGVDVLQDHKIVFDFQNQTLNLTPSTPERIITSPDTIIVRGRSRFGRLVLADASVDGQRVYAIVDTGSPITIGNQALRQRLERRSRSDDLRQIELTSVTGATILLEYTVTRRIKIGGSLINDLPIAFSDLPLFAQLELTDRPAILLGMDALRLFNGVSIDFGTRRVKLLL